MCAIDLAPSFPGRQDAADGHHAGEASSSKGGDAAPVPSDDEIDALGIKALRELIERAGLSHAGCVEKPELKARAKEAAVALRANAPPPAPGAARAMPPSPPSSPTSVALVGSPVDAVLKIAASQPGGAAAGEALSAKASARDATRDDRRARRRRDRTTTWRQTSGAASAAPRCERRRPPTHHLFCAKLARRPSDELRARPRRPPPPPPPPRARRPAAENPPMLVRNSAVNGRESGRFNHSGSLK